MLKLNFVFLALLALTIFQTEQALALKCYQCDDTDSNCVNDLTKVDAKDCADADANYCITQIDATTGKLTRGCLKATDCPANTKCCDKDSCNTHTICKSCNSAQDPQCAQSNAEQLKSEVCAAQDTQCVKTIDNDKQTQRRCATDDDVKACAADAKTCALCTGANCNTGIFPSDRKRCYQCTGEKTAECNNIAAATNIQSQPCLLYDASEKCYTYGTSATTMQRGCVSDGDANKCQTPASTDLCLTCDQDNCNNRNYKADQSLLCIKCTSSKENTDCLWGTSANNAMNCANQIEYNKPQQCYTELKDGVVSRGCMVDRDSQTDCKSENGCDTCSSSNGCNNMDKADFSCIRCRSNEETKCGGKAEELTGTECRNAVVKGDDKCFEGIWNGVVIRGCLVDGDAQLQAVCNEKDSKQCTTCTGKNCNTAKRSSAASVTFNLALIAATMLLFIGRVFH